VSDKIQAKVGTGAKRTELETRVIIAVGLTIRIVGMDEQDRPSGAACKRSRFQDCVAG